MDADARYDSLLAWVWQGMARRYGIPDEDPADWRLARAQVRAESAFNPRAVSPVGARGLLQIMPATWGEGFEADAFNPERNLERGLGHLGYCWSVFQAETGLERWRFALGAYNAGHGHIITAQEICQRRGDPPDQWLPVSLVLPELTGSANATQTRAYVRTILAEFLAGHGQPADP